MELLVSPPVRVRWFLRPMLWLARRITGKDPLPGRLLAHFPKGAVGAGIFELSAAGQGDLDARLLATARIVASVVSGCPFCVDMNAATWQRAGLKADELPGLFALDDAAFARLGEREAWAARYAVALSRTPVELSAGLSEALRRVFLPREVVVLAHTVAMVNYWARFNQGLGVPAAGFFDESVCRLPAPST
jgi:AhpD family alkylhydroperoxidase